MVDDTVSPKDWKLFRARLPEWQEAYMERLCKEYMELLTAGEKASDKFWALEKRIGKDKKHVGVVAEVTRSKMVLNIMNLLYEGAITREELSDFSEEVRETVDAYIRISGR